MTTQPFRASSVFPVGEDRPPRNPRSSPATGLPRTTVLQGRPRPGVVADPRRQERRVDHQGRRQDRGHRRPAGRSPGETVRVASGEVTISAKGTPNFKPDHRLADAAPLPAVAPRRPWSEPLCQALRPKAIKNNTLWRTHVLVAVPRHRWAFSTGCADRHSVGLCHGAVSGWFARLVRPDCRVHAARSRRWR